MSRTGGGARATLLIAITTIGTLALCVVRFLDTPYEDVPGSLQPESMERSLAAMESELDERLPGVTPACDQAARPARQP